MRRSLARLAEKGGPDPDEVLGRVEPADDLVPADLMIEAVVEDARVKEDIFRRADDDAARRRDPRLEHVLDPDHLARRRHRAPRPRDRDALLQPGAGAETRGGDPRPRRPPTRPPPRSSRSREELGKTPAEARDLPGFVSNRILMPFINEAAYALLEGVAEAEAIDRWPGSASRIRWARSRSPT